MALDKTSLTEKLVKELQARGFETNGPHAKSAAMAEAIAHAVIDEITQNAQVTVDAGSSAGEYSIC